MPLESYAMRKPRSNLNREDVRRPARRCVTTARELSLNLFERDIALVCRKPLIKRRKLRVQLLG